MSKHQKISIVLGCILAVLIAVVAILWARYGYRTQTASNTSYAMGSYVQQTVYGKNAQTAATQAAQAVTALENQISWRVESSDITKLNNASGTVWHSKRTAFLTPLCCR